MSREIQFIAIVQHFDDDDNTTAEFVKFSAISSTAFKTNLRAVIQEKFRLDIFGGVYDVFYLDDKIEVKLNLLGDVSDFLLWIGCFFDDQLLHLTFKLRMVIRRKKAFNRPGQSQVLFATRNQQSEQQARPQAAPTNILLSRSASENRPSAPPKYEEAVSKPLISNSPLFKPEQNSQQRLNHDSDEDMEISLQPLAPKKTGLSIKKKAVEDAPKLDTIRKELQQVEELELITIQDVMLEAIETATNGDSEKMDAIRQFLDLEDEPASYFSEIGNLKKLLQLFEKCEWNLDRVMEE